MVSGLVCAADVDDDDVANAKFPIRIPVMWVCTVRAGTDDNECHLRMSFGDNRFGDIRGDVGLGSARNQELRHPRMHPVDGRAGLAQRVNLGGVLHHSQSPQHAGGQYRQHTEDIGQRQQMQRRHGIGDGGGRGGAPEGRGDQLVGVVAVDPIPHGQPQIRDSGLLQRGQLQSRHHDSRVAGDRQHQRGEPLEGLRTRAEQIPQVIAGGDHQTG